MMTASVTCVNEQLHGDPAGVDDRRRDDPSSGVDGQRRDGPYRRGVDDRRRDDPSGVDDRWHDDPTVVVCTADGVTTRVEAWATDGVVTGVCGAHVTGGVTHVDERWQ